MRTFNLDAQQGVALLHVEKFLTVLGLFVGLACIVYGLALALADHMGRAARRKGQGH